MADAPSSRQPGVVAEPLRAYNFMLAIAGQGRSYFTEVSGLGVRVANIAYREGGRLSVVRALPGQVSYSPVVLRYGLSEEHDLWDWLMSAANGQPIRNSVEISVLDNTGAQESVAWELARAWPTEWLGAPLRSMTSELAIDTLVLAHEGITRRPIAAG